MKRGGRGEKGGGGGEGGGTAHLGAGVTRGCVAAAAMQRGLVAEEVVFTLPQRRVPESALSATQPGRQQLLCCLCTTSHSHQPVQVIEERERGTMNRADRLSRQQQHAPRDSATAKSPQRARRLLPIKPLWAVIYRRQLAAKAPRGWATRRLAVDVAEAVTVVWLEALPTRRLGHERGDPLPPGIVQKSVLKTVFILVLEGERERERERERVSVANSQL